MVGGGDFANFHLNYRSLKLELLFQDWFFAQTGSKLSFWDKSCSVQESAAGYNCEMKKENTRKEGKGSTRKTTLL